jgi:hypothetical protein
MGQLLLEMPRCLHVSQQLIGSVCAALVEWSRLHPHPSSVLCKFTLVIGPEIFSVPFVASRFKVFRRGSFAVPIRGSSCLSAMQWVVSLLVSFGERHGPESPLPAVNTGQQQKPSGRSRRV